MIENEDSAEDCIDVIFNYIIKNNQYIGNTTNIYELKTLLFKYFNIDPHIHKIDRIFDCDSIKSANKAMKNDEPLHIIFSEPDNLKQSEKILKSKMINAGLTLFGSCINVVDRVINNGVLFFNKPLSVKILDVYGTFISFEKCSLDYLLVKGRLVINNKFRSEVPLMFEGNININIDNDLALTKDILDFYGCNIVKNLYEDDKYVIKGDYDIYDEKSLKNAIITSNLLQGI